MKSLKKLLSLLVVLPALGLVACDPEPDPEPVDYSISQITFAGQEVTVRGVIDAKTRVGAVLADDTGAIYIYGSELTSDLEIGDYVEVKGTPVTHGNFLQFHFQNSNVELTHLLEETPDFTLPEAQALTADIVNTWDADQTVLPTDTIKYTWTATAQNSGDYVILPVEGYSGDLTVEAIYPTQTFKDGYSYTVTAYYGGISSSSYANMYVTDATDEKAPELESITIRAEGGATEVGLGKTLQLYADMSPVGATGEVTWSSSSDVVATVDNTGKVTGVKEGSATITAAVEEIKGTYEITVANESAETKSVTFDFSAPDIVSNADAENGEKFTGEEVIIKHEGITLDWTKASGSNDIAIENNSLKYTNPARFYQGHKIVLSVEEESWVITGMTVNSDAQRPWNTTNVSSTTASVTIDTNLVSVSSPLRYMEFTFINQTRAFSFTINLSEVTESDR